MILGTGIGIQFTSGAGFSLADSLINSLCERSTTCENKAGTKSILNDLNVSNECGNVLLLIAGQSNAKGSTGGVPSESYLNDPIPSTYIWTGSSFDQLEINVNNESSTNSHGIELNFGYLSQLSRNGNVYIVKEADGGTGFVDNQWNPGDPLYNDLVTQANAAIADLNSTNTQFHFAGIYWNQGEKETSTNGTYDIYASLLGTMVSNLRSDITGASNMRFMFTRLGTYYTTRTNAGNATQLLRAVEVRAQQELADTQISNSFMINQDDLTDRGDQVHADSASQNILASRVFNIIKDLL
jgi:hypothetical protein